MNTSNSIYNEVKNTPSAKIKTNRAGTHYVSIYGVRSSLIKALQRRRTKKEELLYIDTLIYLSFISRSIPDIDLTEAEEDYCYPELWFDDVKVPHAIKDLYSRDRMLEIENHIIQTDNSLMQKDLIYHSAKTIKLISEGVHYTIGKEDADLMLNRLKVLRQRQCNRLPFNSTGFVIDVRIGEKNYLARLLTEHDRKTKEGKVKIAEGIKRMRGLRGKVDKFNNLNMVAPDENDTPDVGQFYTKGRLYSFITEVPREYRAAMYYVDADNKIEDVVDLDIRASHTNFLPIVLEIMSEQLLDGLQALNVRTELGRYKELLKDLKKKSSDLYHKIATDMKTTRDEIKEQWQKYINDPKSNYVWSGNNKVDGWFSINFPELHKMINECHKIERKNTNQKTKWRSGKGYTASISLQLHKIENQLFVKPAAEHFLGNSSLHSDKSRASIMTVHDSFLVPSSSKTLMEKVLDNQIKHNSIFNFIQIKTSTSSVIFSSLVFSSFFNLSFFSYSNSYNTCTISNKLNLILSMSLRRGWGLKGTKSKTAGTRDRASVVHTMPDGRYTVKIKGKKYNSRKNETQEQFETRIGIS